jgi:hypothetical protein
MNRQLRLGKYEVDLGPEKSPGVVEFEFVSLQSKCCTIKDLVPPPRFQLWLRELETKSPKPEHALRAVFYFLLIEPTCYACTE